MQARRSRIGRLFALALLCLLLAPGTWWRQDWSQPERRHILSIRELAISQPPGWSRTLRLTGIWELDSPNSFFGGYSALLALPDERLSAYSDRGAYLDFSAPGAAAPREPRIATIVHIPIPQLRNDIESAARDPDSSVRWLGLETNNAIARLTPGQGPEYVLPPLMRDWPKNQGAEAMTRLADGRFIVLAEGALSIGRKAGPGILFSGDPVAGASAIAFRFTPPAGFHPTDMAALPDGRVLILLRGLKIAVPPFRAMLVIADPEKILEGEEWPWTLVSKLSPPLPRENYEGLAIAPTSDGRADIWIISDDNRSGVQRTLLVKMHWTGEAGARKGAPEAPDAP
jgi:hypothetical protein